MDNILNDRKLQDIDYSGHRNHDLTFIIHITTSISDKTSKAVQFLDRIYKYMNILECIFDNSTDDVECVVYGKMRKMNSEAVELDSMFDDRIYDDYFIMYMITGKVYSYQYAYRLMDYSLSGEPGLHVMSMMLNIYKGHMLSDYIKYIGADGWFSLVESDHYLTRSEYSSIKDIHNYISYLFMTNIDFFMLVCNDTEKKMMNFIKRNKIQFNNCFNNVDINWKKQSGTLNPVITKNKFDRIKAKDNVYICAGPFNHASSFFVEFEFNPKKTSSRVRFVRHSGSCDTAMQLQSHPQIQKTIDKVCNYTGTYTLLYTVFQDIFSSKDNGKIRLYLVLDCTNMIVENAFGKKTVYALAIAVDFKSDLSDMENGLDIIERLTGVKELDNIKENLIEAARHVK